MQVLVSQSKTNLSSAPRTKVSSAPVADASEPLAPVYSTCGWFDSSFELHNGLQVTEDQDASLLQLWARALSKSLNGMTTRH